MSAIARALCAAAVLACLAAPSATTAQASAPRQAVVSYGSPSQLDGLRVLRRIPELHVAVVDGGGVRPRCCGAPSR